PEPGDRLLNVRPHFEVVQTYPVVAVRLKVTCLIPARGEQPVNLLDATFVDAFLFHYLEEKGDVERDDRDGGAGLGDDSLIDGDEGASVRGLQEFLDLARPLIEISLGPADGAVVVDRPRYLGSDVGVGEGG